MSVSVFQGAIFAGAYQPRRRTMMGQYPCPNLNCRSVFNSYYNLRSHINNHCGKPPRFKCPHCDYQTTWRNDVKRHVINKHQDAVTPVVELYKPNSQRIDKFICPTENCYEIFRHKKLLIYHLQNRCGNGS